MSLNYMQQEIVLGVFAQQVLGTSVVIERPFWKTNLASTFEYHLTYVIGNTSDV